MRPTGTVLERILSCRRNKEINSKMKITSTVYKAIAAELDDHDIDHRVRYSTRHPAVVFDYNGRSHSVFFSLSARNWRAPVQTRAIVRRILRQPKAA
jgi:hypothetical protein